MRALAGVVFALTMFLSCGASLAQQAQTGQVAIQLRLTSTMTGKVDYYISPPGAAATYVGSIQPGATIEIESRQGNVYLFAVNRVPFQRYTVRVEKFQHLTVAPKDQQHAPEVADEYQGTPDTMQPPDQMEPATSSQQNADSANTGGMSWQYGQFNNDQDQGAVNASLVFGIPETDAVQFAATCSARSGGIPVLDLPSDVSQFPAGTGIKAGFTAQGFDRQLNGVVVKSASDEGFQGVRVSVPSDDPLWQALPRLSSVNYTVARQPPVALPLRGAAGPLASFLRDCRSFAQGVAPSAGAGSTSATSLFADNSAGGQSSSPPPGGNSAADDSCRKLKNARAKPGGTPVTVTFVNRTNEFRFVVMIDDDGTQIEFAHLQGGQSFKADTTSTQPWMMTDGPGNCIEMMVPSPNRSVFQITRASPGFGPDND